MIVAAVAAIAGGYQALAIVACWRFYTGRQATGVTSQEPAQTEPRPSGSGQESVCTTRGAPSVLKPVNGIDSGLIPAIESHSKLRGDYELLCGVRPGDPAAGLLAQFPRVRLIESRTKTPNGKVGVLIDLARDASHDLLIVNDADIQVDPDYLERVTAPLLDPKVGLVTCLYRAEGSTFAARFEALGVNADFAPSALVGWLLGLEEFAGGSTLAFRRADLERMGGFQSIADYLADDYQLGLRLRRLGLKCVLSDSIVATHLGGGWRDVWTHQLRWARTIRVSNPAGYFTLPVTFATLWAFIAAITGHWVAALVLLALRLIMAFAGAWVVLRSRDALRLWPLIPMRDLFAAAVWCAGLAGRTVVWRGERLRLDREGRIRA